MASNGWKTSIPAMLIDMGAILLHAWQLCATALQVTFVPWRITYDPIAQLLQADASTNAPTTSNSSNMSMADDLTLSWTERKLSELSYVGITVRCSLSISMRSRNLFAGSFKCALIAGVVSAAFSWRDLDQMFWATKGLWYGSLIVDLTSISLATQQSLALNRICCSSDRFQRIRTMLGTSKDGQGISKPRWTQIYVWQVPIMLLNIGLILFLAGLASEIFAHFDYPLSSVDIKVSLSSPPCIAT
jgi:hypothetical protein